MTTPFADACLRIDAGADLAAEAAALVGQMTLAEKLGCLDGDTPFWPGLFDMTSGGYYRHTWPAAVVERLGVPGIEFSDGPRGAVIADGTAFPVSMARGAMFDPALEERVGDAIGLELRASGATYTGAVCMNLLRHPAWGRAQETYGEDPHHVGRSAAAFTAGLERHVMACMKHFALNSMENARFSVDVTADERALHEVYLPHFRHVAEQGIASVMSAYNSVNGEWCGENQTLLTDILRGEWKWPGFVTSDFVFGLRDAVASVEAGLDIEMPFRQQRAVALADAIDDGRLDVATVDLSVTRTVATFLSYRQVFEHRPSVEVIGCAPHRTLARHVGAASTVMLRNDCGLLPVAPSAVRSLVVVGRLAGVANLGDGGSSDVKSTSVVTPLAGLQSAFADAKVVHVAEVDDDPDAVAAADLVVVIAGYTKDDEGEYIDSVGTAELAGTLFPPMDHPELGVVPAAAPAAGTGHSSGGEPSPSGSTVSSDEAKSNAADAVPEAGSSDPSAVDATDGAPDGGMSPGGDRVSLRLSDADEVMITAAASANANTVVSVQCGSAVIMPWADDVSTVLVSWYGGVEGGHALADVITGASEPGGRLPFAIPTSEEHLVDFDKDATEATYSLLHGQWYLDANGTKPAFAFGTGSGFTTWELSGASMRADGRTAAVTVRNTGDRAGSTVVFVHASVIESAVDRPPTRLVGFVRLHAQAGGTASADVEIDWRQLDVRREDDWWVEPATYELSVGFDSAHAATVLSVDRR